MANNVKYSVALKNSRLDRITALVGASGLLRVYDGAQPASPDVAVGAQVKLVEFVCNASAFAAAAASGVLTASAIASALGLAAGTAAWFRLCTSGGTAVIDGTVGTSGTDCIIANTSITVGEPVSVSSLTVTSGN